MGRLPNHGRIRQKQNVNLMVTLLGTDHSKVSDEAAHTRGSHARFDFLEKLYNDHVKGGTYVDGDNVHVEYHRHYILKCYLLFLIDTPMFMDKNAHMSM